jgi:alpha-1,2-mannosyltransferase
VRREAVLHAPARALPTPATRLDSYARAGRRIVELGAFAALPVALMAIVLALSVGDDPAFDFRQFWQGGRDVVHGVSPYPDAAAVASVPDSADLEPERIQDVFRFPYPAPAAVLIAPLGALPFGLAATLLTLASLLAVGGALWLLGVRDWRCYGVAVGSILTIGAVRLGTLTPLLLLGTAVAWQRRDDRRVAVPVVALLVVLKVFMWPLLVWLVATRRAGSALWATVLGAAATLVSWAAIGFDGLADYPDLLSKLSAVVQDEGYSLVALGLSLGLSDGVARAVSLVAGGALLASVVVVARRRDGDRRSYSLAIAAALALSPIVWLHYFLLLLAPIALARPRLAALWAVPVAYWAIPYQETDGSTWRIALGLGLAALAVAATVLPAAEGARRGLRAAVPARGSA